MTRVHHAGEQAQPPQNSVHAKLFPAVLSAPPAAEPSCLIKQRLQLRLTSSSCCRRSASGSCSRLRPSRYSRSKAKMQTGTAAQWASMASQASKRACRCCGMSSKEVQSWCQQAAAAGPARSRHNGHGPQRTADGAELHAGAAAGGQLLKGAVGVGGGCKTPIHPARRASRCRLQPLIRGQHCRPLLSHDTQKGEEWSNPCMHARLE